VSRVPVKPPGRWAIRQPAQVAPARAGSNSSMQPSNLVAAGPPSGELAIWQRGSAAGWRAPNACSHRQGCRCSLAGAQAPKGGASSSAQQLPRPEPEPTPRSA